MSDQVTQVHVSGFFDAYANAPGVNDPDSAWIVDSAARAMRAGRYRLAKELISLAQRARAYETRVQEPQPLRPAAEGPTGHGDHDLAEVERAAQALFGPGQEERLRLVPRVTERPGHLGDATSHAPQVCGYPVSPGARCHQPIAWTETPGSRGHTGTWYHLDGSITDHPASLG